MVATQGLVGLRPAPGREADVVSPPYDVIKPGSALEATLRGRGASIFHVILGNAPVDSLAQMVGGESLVTDEEPAYYVIEQTWSGGTRTGVYLAAEVTDYAERQVIRHEKTFDEKVRGRIELAKSTGLTIGPVFLLTAGELSGALDAVKRSHPPLYEWTGDYGGGTDLHGVATRVWRATAASAEGQAIHAVIEPHPLYIADGHHRYHAALRGGQTHLLAYVTEEARILAYDRVINGVRPFAEIQSQLALQPASDLATPAKNSFCLYADGRAWTLAAEHVPSDVVGRLDCSILERELYPLLELTHDQIVDSRHFDYYPESALEEMKAAVDAGRYELAVALHPVSLEELMAVADAGLEDPDVVMPEKSTFFSPKIPTGLFLYRHSYGG